MKRTILSLGLLFCAALTAADVADYNKQIEQQYGPEYFFAIQGEVSGQAAPGVQSVTVNNQPVAIGPDLTFKARVTLKEGEKYLSIETRYKGLRFTKKYLVIRHPKAPKTFKINLPQEEFRKIVTRRQPPPKRPVARPPAVKKPPPKPKPTGSFGLKASEFKDRYDINTLARAVEADDYGFQLKSKPGTLPWLNELLRQPNFYDVWKTKNKKVFLNKDIERLIKETAAYRHKPFDQLTREQQLKIIRLNRLLLEATYPLFCPKSLAEGELAPSAQNWLGFEFVAELEPGRLLVVRRVDGKFFAAIYVVRETLWVPLAELSAQELADLLDRGTVPLFIRPAK